VDANFISPLNSTSFQSLLLLSFLLGAKHGLEADHLVAIDSLTRIQASANRRTCGALFSLGHGLVVLVVAVLLAALGAVWAVPQWISDVAMVISTGLLLILGGLNVWMLLSTPSDKPLTLHSPRLFVLRHFRFAAKLGPLAIGVLMAVSFETFTLAFLFASSLAQAPLVGAILLGAVFTLGMMSSDGLNGWVIASLMRRADATAVAASRLICLAIALTCFFVGALGLMKLLSINAFWHFDSITSAYPWMLSTGVCAIIFIAYFAGLTKAKFASRTMQ
jgi:nickel/cobalt transporter (NiCoT) family protein